MPTFQSTNQDHCNDVAEVAKLVLGAEGVKDLRRTSTLDQMVAKLGSIYQLSEKILLPVLIKATGKYNPDYDTEFVNKEDGVWVLGGTEIKIPRVFLTPESAVSDQIVLDWRTSFAVGYGRIEFKDEKQVLLDKDGFYATMWVDEEDEEIQTREDESKQDIPNAHYRDTATEYALQEDRMDDGTLQVKTWANVCVLCAQYDAPLVEKGFADDKVTENERVYDGSIVSYDLHVVCINRLGREAMSHALWDVFLKDYSKLGNYFAIEIKNGKMRHNFKVVEELDIEGDKLLALRQPRDDPRRRRGRGGVRRARARGRGRGADRGDATGTNVISGRGGRRGRGRGRGRGRRLLSGGRGNTRNMSTAR